MSVVDSVSFYGQTIAIDFQYLCSFLVWAQTIHDLRSLAGVIAACPDPRAVLPEFSGATQRGLSFGGCSDWSGY